MSDRPGDPNPTETTPAGEIVPAAPSARRALRLAWLALVLVVIAAAALTVSTHQQAFYRGTARAPQEYSANSESSPKDLASPQPAPGSPGANGSDAAALNARIASLEARFSAIEGQVQSASSNPSPELMTRLAALEAEVARAADKETQTELAGRIARLEAQNSGDALRRAANVLALATLARATRDASPFRVELDALAGTVPNDPVIAILQPIADAGAPTIAMLAARFPQAARAVLDTERKAGATGFFSRLWASLASLVSIRPVGNIEGNATADRLARAEAALARNDLVSAVREAEALMGAAGSAIAPWLKDAQARLAIESAIAQMDSRIVQALASSTAQSSPP